jgi:hypothetical protein
LRCQWLRCACTHALSLVAQLSFILLCPAIKHYPSQPIRVTRYYLYLEDPFIPFCLMQARRPCLGIATLSQMESSLLPVIDNVRGVKLLFRLDCSLNDGSLLLFSGWPHSWRLPGRSLPCASPWAVKAVLNTHRRRRSADPTCYAVHTLCRIDVLRASWDFHEFLWLFVLSLKSWPSCKYLLQELHLCSSVSPVGNHFHSRSLYV